MVIEFVLNQNLTNAPITAPPYVPANIEFVPSETRLAIPIPAPGPDIDPSVVPLIARQQRDTQKQKATKWSRPLIK
jgi:hypothetical protein